MSVVSQIEKLLLDLASKANPSYRILYQICTSNEDLPYDISFVFEATCDAEAVIKFRNYILDQSEGKEDMFDIRFSLIPIEYIIQGFFDNTALWIERVNLRNLRIL